MRSLGVKEFGSLDNRLANDGLFTELSHPKIILNHSIPLLVCAHDSPPLDQGEGLGVGLYLIDNQRYYSWLQYPTPGPSPQMGTAWRGIHGYSFHIVGQREAVLHLRF